MTGELTDQDIAEIASMSKRDREVAILVLERAGEKNCLNPRGKALLAHLKEQSHDRG